MRCPGRRRRRRRSCRPRRIPPELRKPPVRSGHDFHAHGLLRSISIGVGPAGLNSAAASPALVEASECNLPQARHDIRQPGPARFASRRRTHRRNRWSGRPDESTPPASRASPASTGLQSTVSPVRAEPAEAAEERRARSAPLAVEAQRLAIHRQPALQPLPDPGRIDRSLEPAIEADRQRRAHTAALEPSPSFTGRPAAVSNKAPNRFRY